MYERDKLPQAENPLYSPGPLKDDYSHMAIYTVDPKGMITYYNEKASELWGRSPNLNDPLETPFSGGLRLFSPDGMPLPHDQCPMAKAVKEQAVVRGEEICIEKPDGKRSNLLMNIDPLYDKEGNLSGAINVFYDITERLSREEIRGRLAAIVESSDDAIVSKTLDGTITSWNKGAERIFGWAAKEIIGKSIITIIPSERQKEEQYILDRISQGKRVESFETVRQKKDGKRINISVTISPVRNSMGKIIGASKIARDITLQQKARQQLKLYNEKLQELNQQKNGFLTIASHELKTPITIMKAHLELLERGLKGEKEVSRVREVVAGVDRLAALVSKMLDISKIESGELELHYSNFDLDSLITSLISRFHRSQGTNQIITGAPLGKIPVKADKQRMEQVIWNLLSNAVKFSDNGSKVVVKAGAENGKVRFSVQDFGPGISQKGLEKVFSRFSYAGPKAPASHGFGIGLYISKEIVALHQGKIWVDSEVGRGSTFHVEIPQKL